MMSSRRRFLLAVALTVVSARVSISQTEPTWHNLVGAPTAQARADDASFISENVGWVVNGSGQIWKTTNGGTSWSNQLNQTITYFRCVGFADSLRGWACNLGTEEFGGATDTNIIYQTTNSGLTWSVNDNFIGPKPRGLCGMRVLDPFNIVAVGRVRGPALFIRSTDGGMTWHSKDMSTYAAGLVDCHFITPDSGFAVGQTNQVMGNSRGVILFTSDGGETWETRYTTSRTGEWCWKITFATRTHGFVSLQKNSGAPVNFLKTTNGGVTWEEKLFLSTAYFAQGIGFATPLRGWIGGSGTATTYGTTDGGETWFPANFGSRINRFRFVNDTVGYATGGSVYKYFKDGSTGISESDHPLAFALHQNHPNPFNPNTTIQFAIPVGTYNHTSLRVYDLLGRDVATLVNEVKQPGSYAVTWDAKDVASGVYFYRLVSGGYVQTRKMVIAR